MDKLEKIKELKKEIDSKMSDLWDLLDVESNKKLSDLMYEFVYTEVKNEK